MLVGSVLLQHVAFRSRAVRGFDCLPHRFQRIVEIASDSMFEGFAADHR